MKIVLGIICFILVITAVVAIPIALEQSTHTFVCHN